ncbi:MAG: Lrp/AsnC ligand binding domain-containing protein [Nitrosopumilaceae archaeon]
MGKNDFVKSELKQLQEVKEIKRLHGAYDIILKINATNHSSLRNFISKNIRTRANVKSSLTLSVLDPINPEPPIFNQSGKKLEELTNHKLQF